MGEITECRVCKSKDLHKFISLGPQPLANSFLRKEDLTLSEPFYPLDVCLCKNCGLVQLTYVVSGEIMFKNYVYITSASAPLINHFSQLADDVIEKFNFPKNSLVIDIGSNDGTLLSVFKKRGMRTLGVDPATNITKLAEANGIETFNDFFNEKNASKILEEKGKAKIITGTNVFAHVPDLDDFLKGVNTLLEDDGVFVIEVPYLVDLMEKTEFDTIYHEHLSYFALRPLATLFNRFNMQIVDVKRVDIHGGTIRVFVRKSKLNLTSSQNVKELLELEKNLKLDKLETFIQFSNKISDLKERLLQLLRQVKSEGHKIVGWGATAKGNTLLNYFKIDTSLLDYIVDSTPLKQGLYTPGMHIPVFPEEKVFEDKPNYALILAWNFADAIMRRHKKYTEIGGKFIVPIPELKVL